jgi:hypothetical protein
MRGLLVDDAAQFTVVEAAGWLAMKRFGGNVIVARHYNTA